MRAAAAGRTIAAAAAAFAPRFFPDASGDYAATTATAPTSTMISNAVIFYTFCDFSLLFLLYSTIPAAAAARAAAKMNEVHHQLPMT